MHGRFLLAADIGGTFSRFALFSLEKCANGLSLRLLPDSRLKLATADYPSFKALLEGLALVQSPGGYTLLPQGSSPGFKLEAALMAVPGPVDNGRCRAANIPWELNCRDIETVCGVKGGLINDFAAQGTAALYPEVLGLHCLMPGVQKNSAPLALLGAGTGLGSALLLPNPAKKPQLEVFSSGQSFECAAEVILPESVMSAAALQSMQARVLPSEGGHMVFGFVGDAEAAFEAFARRCSARREVIADMAVTGYGLSLLHAFHNGQSAADLLQPSEVSKLIDKHPVVLEWFAKFYGRACRNFVLATLALGGVYLSGGLLSHVPGLLGHPAFAAEFLGSETKAYLLKDVPVFWVSNQDAGLWGAALSGLQLIF